MTRPDSAAGVFETIRVERGHTLCLPALLARLRSSVRALYGVEVGGELEACVTGALRAARDDGSQRLRIVIAPPDRTRGEPRTARGGRPLGRRDAGPRGRWRAGSAATSGSTAVSSTRRASAWAPHR